MEYTIIENKNIRYMMDEYKTKVRALLFDRHENILITKYGGVILLPGGSIEEGEKKEDAIIRELLEETGIIYKNKELNELVTINYYQNNYPKRNGEFKNRLLTTHYYIGKYKGLSLEKQKLSTNELNNSFSQELISLSELKEMIMKIKSTNPRNMYFQKELLTLLALYDNIKHQPTNNKVYTKK